MSYIDINSIKSIEERDKIMCSDEELKEALAANNELKNTKLEDWQCIDCGQPALFRAECNECGNYILGDDYQENYIIKGQEIFKKTNGDKMKCEGCGSSIMKIEYLLRCASCQCLEEERLR